MAQFEILGGGNSEGQFQQVLSYLFAPASTGLAKTGVLDGLAVSQTGTPSGSVSVAAGAGVAQDVVGSGATFMANSSAYVLDVFTANPVGTLPRNDIVVMDAATLPNAIRVVTGTPNATPTDPTIPSTSVPLSRLRHAANATTIPTAKIDDLRFITSLRQPVSYDSSLLTGAINQAVLPKLYSYRETNASNTVVSGGGFATITFFNTTAAWTGQGGSWAYSSGVWTLPVSGCYRLSMGITYPATANGYRYMRALLDAGVILDASLPAGTGDVALRGSREFIGSAGQTVTFQANQNSGSSIVIPSGGAWLALRYLGPA